jgi:hypothetical protein
MTPFVPDPDARPEPAEPRVMVPMSELDLYREIAIRANILMRVLKAAWGHHYPGDMQEAVELDEALSKLREIAGK